MSQTAGSSTRRFGALRRLQWVYDGTAPSIRTNGIYDGTAPPIRTDVIDDGTAPPMRPMALMMVRRLQYVPMLIYYGT